MSRRVSMASVIHLISALVATRRVHACRALMTKSSVPRCCNRTMHAICKGKCRMPTATSTSTPTPFFSGLLAPALLSLSPLQSIIRFLHDQDAVRLCRVNREHQTIFTRMRLIEPHTLTVGDWRRIEAHHGPTVTAVQLDDLTELSTIPVALRGQLRNVTYERISGPISRDLVPSLLEEFCTPNQVRLRSHDLPILPATLKKLTFGGGLLIMTNNEPPPPGPPPPPQAPVTQLAMLSRVLSDARHLTDVTVLVDDPAIISLLPQTVEKLSLLMRKSEMPKQWPASLTRLSVQPLDGFWIHDGFSIPKSLITLIVSSGYLLYDQVLQSLTPDSSLERIQFGPGISDCSSDLFALLPRHVTHVGYEGQVESSHHLRVESLPDTVKYLSFPLFGYLVKRWPAQLTHLCLQYLPSGWRQDLSNLPDSVTILELPLYYSENVSKWPSSLKLLHTCVKFLDLSSLTERLPPSVNTLSVPITLVRKMMTVSALPRCLTELNILGIPDPNKPFDLRLLPSSLRTLTMGGGVESKESDSTVKIMPVCGLLGLNDRPDLIVNVNLPDIHDDYETDLEAQFLFLTDPTMTRPSVNDPEESQGWLAPPYSSLHSELTSERLASDPFYEPDMPPSSALYELTFRPANKFRPTEGATTNQAIERLKQATNEKPINGVDMKEITSANLLSALRGAFARGAIVGAVNIDTLRSSSDVAPIDPFSPFFGKPPTNLTNKKWISLFESMGHSKITRLRIDAPGAIFDLDSSDSTDVTRMTSPSSSSISSSASSFQQQELQHPVPRAFTVLCHSITRISTLRTLVFRRCDQFNSVPGLLQHLGVTLLSPECTSISGLDLGSNRIINTIQFIVELIRRTRTLKYLDLSETGLRFHHFCLVCQSVTENTSLLTLNLNTHSFGHAGLHALRWTLRENRSIIIIVCSSDFGAVGVGLLAQQRHRRLKERSKYFNWGRRQDFELP